jgi:uncharacterized repeat protein (TIGR01451 family)
MKHILVLVITFLISISSYAQFVEFEDENFKAYLIGLGIDTDGDGEIHESEAGEVTTLHIENSGAISVVGIQSFINLVELSSVDPEIEVIDVSNMTKLEEIKIASELNTQSLIAQYCTSLTNISEYNFQIELDLLDLTGCTALSEIYYFSNIANTIILKDCSNLTSLTIEGGGALSQQNIDLSGCSSLVQLNLQGDYNILDVSSLAYLQDIEILGEINSFVCKDMPSLENLNIQGGLWIDFAVKNCPLLTSVDLNIHGDIEKITINGFPELTTLKLHVGFSENLSITNCQKLIDLEVFAGPIDSFTVADCPALIELNGLSFIDAANMTINNCISMTNLDLLTSIQIQQSLDLTGMISLTEIVLSFAPETIILDGCYNLKSFDIIDFAWTRTLDFSGCTKLEEVNLANAFHLETLILKNGSKETLQIQEAPSLSEICVDPDEFLEIQSIIGALGLVNVNITTNCEFTNAGLPFQIAGRSILDINGDNCATSSQTLPFTKYSITDTQGGEGFFFANGDGEYRFHLPEGEFVYKPAVLYGDDLFTTTPIDISVSFPSDGAEIVQDFCFTPGIPVDIIEVTLIPLEPARPGFDARYLITYTNTGNVTRGGDIKLDFQDDRMDLISADPMADVQEVGFLSWAFDDLIPYETRSIEFTMNLNSPMEMPALNGGDILEFEAMVGPLGNQTVTAYWSNLDQEIVNSFDPNDKTCLDGDILEPSMVGDFIKYMIRFENTGTAEAVNVVVTDSIDGTKFDIKTLEVLHASHNVVVTIEGNIVDFIFKDIYLPFEDATNDGYVTFKIKTWDHLALGDDLRNKAEIYFDFNFPIITNTTSTVVMEPLSIKTNLSATNQISPNPAEDFIDIISSEPSSQIDILAIDGRILRTLSYADKKTSHRIDLQGLNSGKYFVKLRHQDGFSIEKIIKL